MRWPNLIFLICLLTDNLECSYLESSVPEISSFMAERLKARCSVVLHSGNENLKERTEVFKLTKYLAESGNFASAAPFEVYLKLPAYLQQNGTCANTLGIVLGWQEGTKEKFSEVIKFKFN